MAFKQTRGFLPESVSFNEPKPSLLEPLCVVQVAAGGYHSALVTAQGELFSWGRNDHGQLGLAEVKQAAQPRRVELRGVSHVALGGVHSAVRCEDGRAYTFGDNQRGLDTSKRRMSRWNLEGLGV